MMNQLYPIIRRKRRPLVVAESVPDGPTVTAAVVGNVEPAQVDAEAVRAKDAKVRTPDAEKEAD
jgi:hypothetical protein